LAQRKSASRDGERPLSVRLKDCQEELIAIDYEDLDKLGCLQLNNEQNPCRIFDQDG
jgi:hypothetical protein